MKNRILTENKRRYEEFYSELRKRKIYEVPEIVLRSRIVLAKIKKCESLLDVGCGTCYLLHHADSKIKYGIDLVEPPFPEKDIVFIKGDAISALRKIKRKFECIVFSHVLEHLPNPYKVLRLSIKFLETGGKIIILLPIGEKSEFHRQISVKRVVETLRKCRIRKVKIEKNMHFRLRNYLRKPFTRFIFTILFRLDGYRFLFFLDHLYRFFGHPPRQYCIEGVKCT